jgi:sialate O-acetylesterase
MRTNRLREIFTVIFILCIIPSGYSKVKLPDVLGDNMVLQQQTTVKLWGEAKAGAAVVVKPTWESKVYRVNCDKDGKWTIAINTPKAGGPYDISISDGEEIVLKNILVGEVWFCSGQSNMEMPMKGFDSQPVDGANDIIARAKSKTPIRMFTTDSQDGKWLRQFSKTPQDDCLGKWLENSSENVANISATAYYFARYLQDVLDVPVGIVISSWGGSTVEAWMSKEAISPFSEIDLSHLSNDTDITTPNRTPCVLYNAKIHPLTNFVIKGFLWYQGESNIDKADLYAQQMPSFVKDLRSRWNVGDFPFYFVQIAPYKYGDVNKVSAARMREVQAQNMKDIPNSGMVVTTDIGDLNVIHPANKRAVGERLAYWALSQTYDKRGFEYNSPVFKSMEIIDNKLCLYFDNAPLGIAPMGVDLSGFEIAGEDKVYHTAKAMIDTKTRKLFVYSEDISNPIAVRYAYKNYVEASVFSVAGMPVAPFKTDNW